MSDGNHITHPQKNNPLSHTDTTNAYSSTITPSKESLLRFVETEKRDTGNVDIGAVTVGRDNKQELVSANIATAPMKALESLKRLSIQEDIDEIFDSCDADLSGNLDSSELAYALQALGFYPERPFIQEKMVQHDLNFPLNNEGFRKFVEVMESSGHERKLRTVPYARRGLSLGQLKDILAGLNTVEWLPSRCENFNKKHEKVIKAKTMFEMTPTPLSLYVIDTFFVKDTTNKDTTSRKGIPEKVLETAGVPPAPLEDCSFAQLMNPDGMQVDYFVSHFWGHPYERTVQALSNFANGVYKDIGKSTPDDVVFWVCLFALNQHKAAEEVGNSPEEGPFNAALAKARHGAIMVLDGCAEPMKRIWCLYEISRAKEFDQSFRLIVDDGDIEKADIKLVEKITEELLGVSAYTANASRKSDKDAIQYRIMDLTLKNSITTFETFKRYSVDDWWFTDFDLHICSLIATPMLSAGLKSQSATVCMRAIGMGAMVTVSDLKEKMEERLCVDLTANVETRLGSCSLAEVFARTGRRDELSYVMDRGADIGTALVWAARKGHTDVCTLLLDRGADIGVRDDGERTAIIWAAGHGPCNSGNADTLKLLLNRNANIEDKNNEGDNALMYSAIYGHVDVCKLLLDNGAEINEKNNKNQTALDLANNFCHEDVCNLLRDRGADPS